MMIGSDDHLRSGTAGGGERPTAQQLRRAIDSGSTRDKVAFPDPAAAPLGTDDEAAGGPDAPERVAAAFDQETHARTRFTTRRPRPQSPNIQIYRPQLTSVLSIGNRITGVLLSLAALGLVAWLIAAAAGPQAYGAFEAAATTWVGRVVLFGFTFAFFYHLCAGIRHLVWDTVHGFELRSIYLSGWTVVAATLLLTILVWIVSFVAMGPQR